MLKMIIVFFIKAPVFAKETGKPFQLKQDRAFQAGAIPGCVCAKARVVAVGTGGSEGSCPASLPPPPAPVLASQSDIAFLPGTFCQKAGALPSGLRDIQEWNTLPVFYFIFQQRK